MAAAKKKGQASAISVGKRTLESVLIDLAEQVKANDERSANRTAAIEERSARAEEMAARAEERSARAEEMAALALDSIAAVSRDSAGDHEGDAGGEPAPGRPVRRAGEARRLITG